MTRAQMDRWARAFDNWGVCDACCCYVFRKTPFARAKAVEWSRKNAEFVKRAGFALMAYLAVHDKNAGDEAFADWLPIIERESDDDRPFVRKAVNWALRQIGKRNCAVEPAGDRVRRSDPIAWHQERALDRLRRPERAVQRQGACPTGAVGMTAFQRPPVESGIRSWKRGKATPPSLKALAGSQVTNDPFVLRDVFDVNAQPVRNLALKHWPKRLRIEVKIDHSAPRSLHPDEVKQVADLQIRRIMPHDHLRDFFTADLHSEPPLEAETPHPAGRFPSMPTSS